MQTAQDLAEGKNYTPEDQHDKLENHLILNRRYIVIHGWISIVIR